MELIGDVSPDPEHKVAVVPQNRVAGKVSSG